MDLYDPIKASYESQKDAEKRMSNHGYNYDHDLSNMETKIFYNPNAEENKKLMVTFRGTKRVSDILPDLGIGLGGFTNSSRYKEAKEKLEQAKHKYKTNNSLLVGHSLGGSLSTAVSSDKDLVYTFNKGAGGLFNHNTHTKSNEKAYRMGGDLVSWLAKYNTRNINTLGKQQGFLNAHKTDNLKHHKIYI